MMYSKRPISLNNVIDWLRKSAAPLITKNTNNGGGSGWGRWGGGGSSLKKDE